MSRFTLGKRKADTRASSSADFNSQHVAFENPTVKRMHFTTISDSGAREIDDITGRIPLQSNPAPPTTTPEKSESLADPSAKQRTQVALTVSSQ